MQIQYSGNGRRAVRCPNCGCWPFAHQGTPERNCFGCGLIWTATEDVYAPVVSSEPSDARAAALLPYGLQLVDGTILGGDPLQLPDLLMEAMRLGLRQLWVTPAAAELLALPASWEVPEDRQAASYLYGVGHPLIGRLVELGWRLSTDPPGLHPWLGLTWTARDAWVDLVIPQWDGQRNPFAWEGAEVRAVLQALTVYAAELGMRYRRSPGSTGVALMRAVHSEGLALRHLGEPPPPALGPMDGEAPGDWLDLGRLAAEAGYLHAWDVNGMYLAACSSAELGAGDVQHHHRLPDDWHRQPGYWRAAVTGTASIPAPIRMDGGYHWYTTPSLILAVELGLTIHVTEGWTYSSRHRWLAPWYTRLRDARAALMGVPRDELAEGAGEMALKALKATYTQALGWLGGHWHAAGDESFRPDWRATIIGRARANLHRHLMRTYHVCGRLPVGMRADTALYVCPEADPAAAAAALGLPVSPQLGKFKHLGALPIARALELARDARTPVRGLRAIMDALDAEGVS